MNAITMFDKIWDGHVVAEEEGEILIYVDLALIHEGSSHAFEALKQRKQSVARPHQVLAFTDHYVPTTGREKGIAGIAVDEIRNMVIAQHANTKLHGIKLFGFDDPGQGILHIVPPEQGITQPGLLIAGADSHTSTHGAFGAIAFGMGASDMTHVMATQATWQRKPKKLRITVNGKLGFGVAPKDIILAVIAKIGAAGGVGHAIEYAGSTFAAMSMEGRMTVCNMSIEAGAKAGLIAPDEITFEYLKGREYAPSGAAWDQAVAEWRTLVSDDGAAWDKEVVIDAATIKPQITWGTNPAQVLGIDDRIPNPDDYADATARDTVARALTYMGLTAGTPIRDITVDTVFIGSCTNSRIEDLRAAAAVFQGRTVTVKRVMVVPGSHQVKKQAEAEGLDRIFIAAGVDWREPGCSMCLAMNPDKLAQNERSASTSNRNFEGRQGRGGRTHLVSPQIAAATAIAGHFATPADLK